MMDVDGLPHGFQPSNVVQDFFQAQYYALFSFHLVDSWWNSPIMSISSSLLLQFLCCLDTLTCSSSTHTHIYIYVIHTWIYIYIYIYHTHTHHTCIVCIYIYNYIYIYMWELETPGLSNCPKKMISEMLGFPSIGGFAGYRSNRCSSLPNSLLLFSEFEQPLLWPFFQRQICGKPIGKNRKIVYKWLIFDIYVGLR